MPRNNVSSPKPALLTPPHCLSEGPRIPPAPCCLSPAPACLPQSLRISLYSRSCFAENMPQPGVFTDAFLSLSLYLSKFYDLSKSGWGPATHNRSFATRVELHKDSFISCTKFRGWQPRAAVALHPGFLPGRRLFPPFLLHLPW